MDETELERSLKEKCMRYETRISELEGVLNEIAEGKGRYSMEPLEHASNTIEDMKELANDAIARVSLGQT